MVVVDTDDAAANVTETLLRDGLTNADAIHQRPRRLAE